MNVLQKIALFCAVISALLALLFIVLGVVRVLQLWRVTSAAKRETQSTTPAPRDGLAAEKHAAEVVAPVFEAAAKLTDSLSKAPLAVVSIVMALLFMLLAVWSAYLGREPAKPDVPKPVRAATLMPGERCAVGRFASGDHRLPSAIRDEPQGCLDKLSQRLASDTLGVLLVVGRCDIQELRPALRARYTENLSLAYQRGMSVRDFLAGRLSANALAQFDRRLLVLVGGARQSRSEARTDEDFAKDRVVELVPFWTIETSGSVPGT